jgi:cyanate lyase
MDAKLITKAETSLHEFFDKKDGRTSADVAVARIASSLLSTNARERQTAGAADALNFMIARELSGDKTQLEAFLTAAMPTAPIVRRVYEAIEGQGTIVTNMTALQRECMKRAVVQAIWPDHQPWCHVYCHPTHGSNECNCSRPDMLIPPQPDTKDQ